jgi:pantoate--beta-alanine ligase
MGALHEGHCSLIRLARSMADEVITSIFVNPAQFGPGEDFSRYPRPLARDVELASAAGSEILFVPDETAMYPEGYQTYVTVETITRTLEGSVRPGHFRGVTTVVAKLLNITNPHLAVFGQKDAQQVVVIRRMVKDLNMGVDIIVAPIVREPDGLAMSSRNAYLSAAERKSATVLHRSLLLAESLVAESERSCRVVVEAMSRLIEAEPGTVIDYCSIADPDTLREVQELASGMTVLVSLAVRLGGTRLIDNRVIHVQS